MRKLFFTAIILLLSVGFMTAQKAAIPAVVKAKIAALYPNAKKVEWTVEKDNYEAEIEQKGSPDVSVDLNAKGEVLETETDIKVAELPEAARVYITKNLGNAKIKEAAKIVKADNSVMYEAQIGKKDYLFDDNGRFLKIVVK